MKRLLIYLGLLTTLLAMPYHAKADNSGPEVYNEQALKLITNAKNNWADIDHVYDSTTGYYSWTITKEEVEAAMSGVEPANRRIEYKLHLGDSYYGLPSGSRDPGWSSWSVNMGTDDNTYKNAYFSYNSQILSYKIQAKYDGNWHVRVIPKYSTWYLHSNLDNSNDWDGETNYPLSYNAETGFYQTTLDAATIQSASNDDVRFRIYDIAKGSWGPTVNYQFNSTGRTGHIATALGDNPYYSIPKTYGDYNVTFAKIEAQYTDNVLVQVYVTLTMEAIEPHDYYWVSPQITNNQKWPYFKLTALRNRSGSYGDGKISDKYFTFTIKNDDLRRYDGTAINNGDRIDWYIARDDDEVWFRPSTDDPTPTESATSLNIGNSEGYDGNIGYRNFNDCKVYAATNTNNTNKFAFNKGANSTKTSDSDYKNTVKSYTFILNSRKSNDATQGNVYFNYAYNSEPVTTGDCYLLGNFKSATEAEYICNPSDEKYPENQYGPRKMTQYWYVGSTKYDSPQNPCDSIVYEIKVNKPTNGWGNLYLDINPGSNTSWYKVYRPLISLGNTLDGRAMIGGLTTAGAGMSGTQGDQSLNPETSNDYTSYTFRFNATTYTYQLEFHTSLYLVGPGVSVKDGEKGSWDLSKVKSSEPSDPRIRLTATQEKDHYRNRVYFTQGQPFRFIKNIDENVTPNYKYTWHENGNKPKWVQVTTTNKEDYYPGNETQFRNYIQYESDGSESNEVPKDATTNSMTFDLPSGWYYVNFYPNAATPYYTIEHSMELRDFNEVYYRSATGTDEQRNVQGRNDYNFLRVWSDHIAWNKPDNIDVFVVSAFDRNTETHVTTATLEKLDVDYIPANTGVILGCKLSKDNLTSGLVYDNAATLAYNNGENVNYYNTLTAELTPYSAPSTSYSGESKLIPLYEETSLQRFSDETGIGTGDGYANYLFGFYRLNKVISNYPGANNNFGLGFWLTTGVGNTYANSAFVRILKSDAEKMGVGTAYNNIGPASRASFAPAFMLLFDESDDNVITGISDITTAKGNSVASQGWYTLQGVRTPKPTQRGIYIYNGKKVVVND